MTDPTEHGFVSILTSDKSHRFKDQYFFSLSVKNEIQDLR